MVALPFPTRSVSRPRNRIVTLRGAVLFVLGSALAHAGLTPEQESLAADSAAALARGKTAEAARLQGRTGLKALPAPEAAAWLAARAQKLVALGALDLAAGELTAAEQALLEDNSDAAEEARSALSSARDELTPQLCQKSADALLHGKAKEAERLAQIAVGENRLNPNTIDWFIARFALVLHADQPAAAATALADLPEGNGSQLAAQAWLALLQDRRDEAAKLLAAAKTKRGDLPETDLEVATGVWLAADTAIADAYDARWLGDSGLDRTFMPEMRLASAQAYLAKNRPIEAAAMLLNAGGEDHGPQAFAPARRLLAKIAPHDLAIAKLDPFNARLAAALVAGEAAFAAGRFDEAAKLVETLPAALSPFQLEDRRTLLTVRVLLQKPDAPSHARAAWLIVRSKPAADSPLAKLAPENMARLRQENPLWPAEELPGGGVTKLPDDDLGRALAPLFSAQPYTADDPRFDAAETAWTTAWGPGPGPADLASDAGRARWAALARLGALVAHVQHRVAKLTDGETAASGKARGDRLAWSVLCDPLAPTVDQVTTGTIDADEWRDDVWPETTSEFAIWHKSGFGDLYDYDGADGPPRAVREDQLRMARMFTLYVLHPGLAQEGAGALVFHWAQALAAQWPPSTGLNGNPIDRPGLAAWPMIRFAWTVLRDPVPAWDIMVGTGFRVETRSLAATYEQCRQQLLASDYVKTLQALNAWAESGADPAKRPTVSPRWEKTPGIIKALLTAALKNSDHPLQVVTAYEEAVGDGAGLYTINRSYFAAEIVREANLRLKKIEAAGAAGPVSPAAVKAMIAYLDEVGMAHAALLLKEPLMTKRWDAVEAHRLRCATYLAAHDLTDLEPALDQWPAEEKPDSPNRRYFRDAFNEAKSRQDEADAKVRAAYAERKEIEQANFLMGLVLDRVKSAMNRGDYYRAQLAINDALNDEPLLNKYYYDPLHNAWVNLENLTQRRTQERFARLQAIKDGIDADSRASAEARRRSRPGYRESWDEQFAELIEGARNQINNGK